MPWRGEVVVRVVQLHCSTYLSVDYIYHFDQEGTHRGEAPTVASWYDFGKFLIIDTGDVVYWDRKLW